MAAVNFIQPLHRATPRDYAARFAGEDKAACAVIAKNFGQEYFDADRKYGYGGYRYDGRWLPVARAIASHYQLQPDTRILDIGCAKGFLLHDFATILPQAELAGIDVSEYAVNNALADVKDRLRIGTATSLPYPDKSFDLAVSINTLHNLRLPELELAFREIERVAKSHKYVVMDSYRMEREKLNLLAWQLTCECFFTPDEWEWVFRQCGYSGDYEFIFFE